MVSARSTVAPGCAASAAAVALARSAPVSKVSSGPWVMVAGLPAPRGGPSCPPGGGPNPASVPVTTKLELRSTVMGVPSAFFMCTSKALLPGRPCSARMTVAPGWAASAAAVAPARSAPVSAAGRGPRGGNGARVAVADLAAWWAVAATLCAECVVVAAPAIAAPPTTALVASVAPSSQFRIDALDFVTSSFAFFRGLPGSLSVFVVKV